MITDGSPAPNRRAAAANVPRESGAPDATGEPLTEGRTAMAQQSTPDAVDVAREAPTPRVAVETNGINVITEAER